VGTRRIIPFMSFSDSIAGTTGLGRVHRDIVTRIHRDLSDVFRVGSFGIGGPIASSSEFPFFNCSTMRLQQTIPLDLPIVWENFAGRYGDKKQEDSEEDLKQRKGQIRKGVVFCIQNCSWMQYIAQPYLLPPDSPIRAFLLQQPPSVSREHWQQLSNTASPSFSPQLLMRLASSSAPFARWLYCPVDGHLPDGTLGHQLSPILAGFDRLVAYNPYGSEVIERTLEKWNGSGQPNQSPVATVNSIPNLVHGLDPTIFHPRDRRLARETFLSRVSNGQSALPLKPDQILLAMTGTNSARKDWATAFQTASLLLSRGHNIFFWGHTDLLQPHPSAPAVHWDLRAMVRQFGLDNRVVLTVDRISDDDLAWAYSAADCMLATSSEGHGFCPMEALGAGLPVVGTTYAGSAEFTPRQLQVEPVAYRLESPFLIQRPIYSPADVADKVELALAGDRAEMAKFPERFLWENSWQEWWEWLRKGVGE
jgi:glycosyltransferase involved in cell wall biosynthesis